INDRHSTAGVAPDEVRSVGAELGFPRPRNSSQIRQESDQGFLAFLFEEGQGARLIGGGVRSHQLALCPGPEAVRGMIELAKDGPRWHFEQIRSIRIVVSEVQDGPRGIEVK